MEKCDNGYAVKCPAKAAPSSSPEKKPEAWETWLYAFLSWVLQSLASVFGMVLLVCGSMGNLVKIMPFMMALSSGTLIGMLLDCILCCVVGVRGIYD